MSAMYLAQHIYDNLPKQASYSLVEKNENNCFNYTCEAKDGSTCDPLRKVTNDWWYLKSCGACLYQAKDATVSVETC